MTRHLLLASLLAVTTGCLGAPAATFAQGRGQAGEPLVAKAGAFTAGTSGGYSYKFYKPSQAGSAPLPMVVMLHGCGQNPDMFARTTRMNTIADREGFAVLYPEQSVMAHPRQCWRRYDPDDQSRGRGEPAILNGMVDDVAKRESIDRKAVYVAGLSAGEIPGQRHVARLVRRRPGRLLRRPRRARRQPAPLGLLQGEPAPVGRVRDYPIVALIMRLSRAGA